ncbi:head-tail connector protein [Massilia sp. CFBP9026]|uniref:head-tail connector protein n=1 Tax=Massilia sp. CFBP9026 TaxID=3096536 RepID=UPI002A6B428F|nr:hypothetical protein [Massilia sp. CFBP9026]MDY0961741.1 hypothetical protein [Massilia sp. CFBP9026]
MSWKLITPPTGLAVSMVEAQISARADADENGVSPLDGEIQRAIRTYTTEAEGETNRAIMEQTWRLTLDRFSGKIELRRPPLLQVVHVKFYDPENVQRTLDPQDYQIDGESEPGYIVPADGKAWPATASRINAVEVQIRCGYGPDHTSVPDSISGFILARLSEHFQSGGKAENKHVKRLLWPEVVWG